jgi:hypothetical protein
MYAPRTISKTFSFCYHLQTKETLHLNFCGLWQLTTKIFFDKPIWPDLIQKENKSICDKQNY